MPGLSAQMQLIEIAHFSYFHLVDDLTVIGMVVHSLTLEFASSSAVLERLKPNRLRMAGRGKACNHHGEMSTTPGKYVRYRAASRVISVSFSTCACAPI